MVRASLFAFTNSFFQSVSLILKNLKCFSHIYFSVSFGIYEFEILMGSLFFFSVMIVFLATAVVFFILVAAFFVLMVVFLLDDFEILVIF